MPPIRHSLRRRHFAEPLERRLFLSATSTLDFELDGQPLIDAQATLSKDYYKNDNHDSASPNSGDAQLTIHNSGTQPAGFIVPYSNDDPTLNWAYFANSVLTGETYNDTVPANYNSLLNDGLFVFSPSTNPAIRLQDITYYVFPNHTVTLPLIINHYDLDILGEGRHIGDLVLDSPNSDQPVATIHLSFTVKPNPLFTSTQLPFSLTQDGTPLLKNQKLLSNSYNSPTANVTLLPSDSGLFHSRFQLTTTGFPFDLSYLSSSLDSPDLAATSASLANGNSIHFSSTNDVGVFDIFWSPADAPSNLNAVFQLDFPSLQLVTFSINIVPPASSTPSTASFQIRSTSRDADLSTTGSLSPYLRSADMSATFANPIKNHTNDPAASLSQTGGVSVGLFNGSLAEATDLPLILTIQNTGNDVLRFPDVTDYGQAPEPPTDPTQLFANTPFPLPGLLPDRQIQVPAHLTGHSGSLYSGDIMNGTIDIQRPSNKQVLHLALRGGVTTPPSFTYVSFPAANITDPAVPVTFPNPSPVTFPSQVAGVVYSDTNYILFHALGFGETSITSASLEGAGFIAPDLAATHFPVPIYSYSTARFRVYPFATTPSHYTATLHLTTGPDNTPFDIPLAVDILTPNPQYAVTTLEGKTILNGQNISAGNISYTGRNSPAYITALFANTGNTPLAYNIIIHQSFVADPVQPSGGGTSGSTSSSAVGDGPDPNPFGQAEVSPTPGVRPGKDFAVELHVPTRQTGAYTANALVHTSSTINPDFNFSATASVVYRPRSNDDDYRPPTVTGPAQPPRAMSGSLAITSISNPAFSSFGFPTGAAGTPAATTAKISIANTSPLFFYGTVTVRVTLSSPSNPTAPLLTTDTAVDLAAKPNSRNPAEVKINVPDAVLTGKLLLSAQITSSSADLTDSYGKLDPNFKEHKYAPYGGSGVPLSATPAKLLASAGHMVAHFQVVDSHVPYILNGETGALRLTFPLKLSATGNYIFSRTLLFDFPERSATQQVLLKPGVISTVNISLDNPTPHFTLSTMTISDATHSFTKSIRLLPG